MPPSAPKLLNRMDETDKNPAFHNRGMQPPSVEPTTMPIQIMALLSITNASSIRLFMLGGNVILENVWKQNPSRIPNITIISIFDRSRCVQY